LELERDPCPEGLSFAPRRGKKMMKEEFLSQGWTVEEGD
jgi:hypothetical protein